MYQKSLLLFNHSKICKFAVVCLFKIYKKKNVNDIGDSVVVISFVKKWIYVYRIYYIYIYTYIHLILIYSLLIKFLLEKLQFIRFI